VTFVLGSRSLAFSAHVDPRLMAVVKRAIAISPVDFGMTEDQSRTVAQQAAKVAHDLMRCTNITTATGSDLDDIGEMVGLPRRDGPR